MKMAEILEGRVEKGAEVQIEGKIVEVLPTAKLGEETYERLVLEDGTGRLTVVVRVTPYYFFPGDVLRVKGVVKPCFYMTRMTCLETTAEGIEFVKEYRIPLNRRESVSSLGPFKLMALLAFTRLDEYLIDVILDTQLDPLRIAEEADKSERLDCLIELLGGMTLYSVFVRSVEAAKVAETAILLIKPKVSDQKLLGKLELMESFLRAILEDQGFRHVIEPVPVPPIEEVGTELTPEDREAVGPLAQRATEMVKELIHAEGPHLVVVDLPDESPMEGRSLAKLIASEAQAKLLLVSAHAMRENMEGVVTELKALADSLRGPAVVYLEGVEFMLPTDLIKSAMNADLASAFDSFTEEVIEVLRRLSSRPEVVVLAGTISPAMVSSRLLSAAQGKLSMREEEAEKKEDVGMPPYLG